MNTDPLLVLENVLLENEGALTPGGALAIENKDQTPGKGAKAYLLEPRGHARQWTHETIAKWEDLLYRAVGLTHADAKAITNLGQLSSLALRLMFSRSVATSDRKRELWGKEGLCPFFRDMLIGLNNLGGIAEVKGIRLDSAVDCQWGDYFETTDQDKQVLTSRTHDQVNSGTLTLDRAARRIGVAEGIPENELDLLLKELKLEQQRRVRATRTELLWKAKNGLAASQDRSEGANVASALGGNNQFIA